MAKNGLSEKMSMLVRQGCYPGLYFRGNKTWRAHINIGGNSWAEKDTAARAMDEAIFQWEKGGKPMDGHGCGKGGGG